MRGSLDLKRKRNVAFQTLNVAFQTFHKIEKEDDEDPKFEIKSQDDEML